MIKEQEKNKKVKLKFKSKFLLFIILLIIYAFFLGPKGIYIKDYKITSKKINDSMHGLKILQFSDLSYGSTVNMHDVKKIVKKINECNADIVIFTGDLLEKNKDIDEDDKKKIIKYFKNIKSEYGKYYVTGEDDFEDTETILNTSGFINLDNNYQYVYISNNDFIALLSKNNIKEYANTNMETGFNILSIHNPKVIDKYKNYNLDMAISGHTNNGYINIPYIKNLFINSKYNKNYQKVGKTKLFINPGIGTKKVHVRLFNHPTLYLYRLNKPSN